MFSSEIDASRHPITTRAATIAAASLVMIAVIAALVSARTTPGGWAVVCLATIGGAWIATRRGQANWYPSVHASTLLMASLIAFCFYAAASAIWAQNPVATLRAASFVFATIVLTRLALHAIPNLPRLMILHMAEGLWLGLLVALSYFLIEVLTGQFLKLSLYNALGLGPGDIKPTVYFRWKPDGTLKSISLNDMTRNTAPITMFMWPAMLAARAALRPPYGLAVAGLIFVLAAVCVMLSPHETSKISLAFGTVTLALAYIWRRPAAGGLALAWAAACLLILPAALIAHSHNLHNADSMLQKSLRARIIIWNETATQTLKSPILGVGARMTYEIGPQNLEKKRKEAVASQSHEWFPAKLSRHAHNAFLQTWFELGAIGIILLTACGVLTVRAIIRLNESVQPLALATFASATTIAASSYGMYQAWFIGLFALTPLLFTIAMVTDGDSTQTEIPK